MPNGKSRQETRDLGRECPAGILAGEQAKIQDLALNWSGELDHGPVTADDLTECIPQMLESLPQGSSGLNLGRLTPEEAGELLTRVGARLEDQIGEEGKYLGSRLRHERPSIRERHGGWTEQCQDDTRHITFL
jgi:hypothetical protein